MSNAQVLVVDDEADIRTLIKDILSDEGYGVTVAGDADAARKARASTRFDLIFLAQTFSTVNSLLDDLYKIIDSVGSPTDLIIFFDTQTLCKVFVPTYQSLDTLC